MTKKILAKAIDNISTERKRQRQNDVLLAEISIVSFYCRSKYLLSGCTIIFEDIDYQYVPITVTKFEIANVKINPEILCLFA